MTPTAHGSRLPGDGYAALRRFRWSAEGSNYFLTFNATRPTDKLAGSELLAPITAEREKLEHEGDWMVRTWVTMPDHIHALVRLGVRASLAENVRRFKGRLAPTLRRNGLTWQDGYYDHQMRADEDALPVFLYIFLNPYRAGLVRSDEKWSGFYWAPEDWKWFAPFTNSETPFPEWLR
ncbi:MAG: transposase [Opitutus sp.]|nr:transposase [Opitutus sp.]